MVKIELTESEAATLSFYLGQSLVDAEGKKAIGVGDQGTVDDLKSVMRKIGKETS